MNVNTNNSVLRQQMSSLNIAGRVYPLSTGLNTIGRNKIATVILKHESISQQHAIITITEDGKHFLSDMHSFNGTYLEKEKLRPLHLYEISEGSRILFANINAVYTKIQKDPITSIENKSTQDYQSFYMGETQCAANLATQTYSDAKPNDDENLAEYFEDDFHFPNICSTTDINTTSINDMPTQLLENIPSTSAISSSKLSINDLPTQLLTSITENDATVDITTNEVNEKSIENNQETSITCFPMQALPLPTEKETTNTVIINKTKEITIEIFKEISTQILCPFDEIAATVEVAASGMTTDTTENDKTEQDSANRFSQNLETSVEMIETSVLSDCEVVDTSTIPCSLPTTNDKVTLSLDSDSQSQLQCHRLSLRRTRPITDDSDESDSEEIVRKRPKCKPISTLSCNEFEFEISHAVNENNQLQKNSKQQKDSDSETDTDNTIIEPIGNLERTNTKDKSDLSGSETDIEDFDESVITDKNENPTKIGSPTYSTTEKHTNDNNILKNDNATVAANLSDDDEDEFSLMQHETSSVFQLNLSNGEKNVSTEECFSEKSVPLDLSAFMKALETSNEENADKVQENVSVDCKSGGEMSDISNTETSKETSKEDVLPLNSENIQKITVQIQASHSTEAETLHNQSNLSSDSVFLRPTQNCATQDNQSVYDMETQKCTDDVFLQPTQKFKHNENSVFELETQAFRNDEDDIFNQSTQQIEGHKIAHASKEDIFNEPTQRITDADNKNEDIFIQSTQILTTDAEINNKDVFLKPTQILLSPKKQTKVFGKTETSPIRKKQVTTKVEEIESQLEVIFASQPLKPDSQVSTRPSNPLANLLEEQNTEEYNFPSNDTEEVTNKTETACKKTIPLKTKQSKRLKQTSKVEECTDKNRKEDYSNPTYETFNKKLNQKLPQNDLQNEEKRNTSTPNLKKRLRNNENNVINAVYEHIPQQATFDNNGNEEKKNNKKVRIQEPEHDEINTNETVTLRSTRSQKKAETKQDNSKIKLKTSQALKNKTKVTKKNVASQKKTTSNKKNASDSNETKITEETANTEAIDETPQVTDKSETNVTTKSSTRVIRNKAKATSPAETSRITRNKTIKVINDVAEQPGSGDITQTHNTSRKLRGKKINNLIDVSEEQTDDFVMPNKVEDKSKKEKVNVERSNTKKTRECPTNDTSNKQVEPVKYKKLYTPLDTPERSRARHLKTKVVFTMMDNPELETAIRSLGGMMVDSVDACTVLVTGSLQRTAKLLTAVGQGKPICSPLWIRESKKANTILDPWKFILKDTEAEAKWNLSLQESLKRSQSKKLLKDFTFQLAVNNSVDVIKAAIEACGGKYVSKTPKSITKNFIIVASPENSTKYSKYLKQNPPLTVVAPEGILDGVLRQELRLNDHMLTL